MEMLMFHVSMFAGSQAHVSACGRAAQSVGHGEVPARYRRGHQRAEQGMNVHNTEKLLVHTTYSSIANNPVFLPVSTIVRK